MKSVKEQPLANTTNVVALIKQLEIYSREGWKKFAGNAQTFIALQNELKTERELYELFWEGGSIDKNANEFLAWNCLPAYDDMPQDIQLKTIHYYDGMPLKQNKYDIEKARHEYLDNLWGRVFRLFQDWQFCTQGCTIY